MSLGTLTNHHAAFKAGDVDAMPDCASEDVQHRVNEGGIRHGLALFAQFCTYVAADYRKTLSDIDIFSNEAAKLGAAEFTVHGQYPKTDLGLPVAGGQSCILPAGAFFDLRDGKISRLTTFCNLEDWKRQVSE